MVRCGSPSGYTPRLRPAQERPRLAQGGKRAVRCERNQLIDGDEIAMQPLQGQRDTEHPTTDLRFGNQASGRSESWLAAFVIKAVVMMDSRVVVKRWNGWRVPRCSRGRT